MRIVDIETVEDCFDRASTFRYMFDCEWTRDKLTAIEPLGRLEYFASFPRPFFRLIGDGGGQVKGVVGDTTCLLILPTRNKEILKQQFEASFADEVGNAEYLDAKKGDR